MFEEIQKHRQAVEENIKKSFQSDVLEAKITNEVEKAHNVGDMHPNGKWVWVEYKPGKFDWRPVKGRGGVDRTPKPVAQTTSSAPLNKQPDNQPSSAPVSKTPDSSVPKSTVIGAKTFEDVLAAYKSGKANARQMFNGIDYDLNEYERQLDMAKKVDDDAMGMGLQIAQKNLDDYKEKLRILKKEHPGAQASMAKLYGDIARFNSQVKAIGDAIKARANQQKQPKFADYSNLTYEEAKKIGVADAKKVSDYRIPDNLRSIKNVLESLIGSERGRDKRDGDKQIQESYLHDAVEEKVGSKTWRGVVTEESKSKAIKEWSDKLATTEAIVKRVKAKQAELNKEKKEFLEKTGHDFTEEEIWHYIYAFNTKSFDEPDAEVVNKWNYWRGAIGSTSATIKIGKGKPKPFSIYDAPSWRPIGVIEYSIPGWGLGSKSIPVKIPVQSWKDVQKGLSETESFSLTLFKHPKQ